MPDIGCITAGAAAGVAYWSFPYPADTASELYRWWEAVSGLGRSKQGYRSLVNKDTTQTPHSSRRRTPLLALLSPTGTAFPYWHCSTAVAPGAVCPVRAVWVPEPVGGAGASEHREGGRSQRALQGLGGANSCNECPDAEGGIQVTALRAAPSNAAVFFAYEMCMKVQPVVCSRSSRAVAARSSRAAARLSRDSTLRAIRNTTATRRRISLGRSNLTLMV